MCHHPPLKRTTFAGVAALTLGIFAAATPAAAEIEYPWCLMPGRFTPASCTFTTLEQCKATSFGNIGYCDRNPRYVPAQMSKRRR
jgi:Protein of unknown function (DUF3551)